MPSKEVLELNKKYNVFYGYYTIEIASIMLPREEEEEEAAAAAVFFFGLGHFGTLVFFPVKINKTISYSTEERIGA